MVTATVPVEQVILDLLPGANDSLGTSPLKILNGEIMNSIAVVRGSSMFTKHIEEELVFANKTEECLPWSGPRIPRGSSYYQRAKPVIRYNFPCKIMNINKKQFQKCPNWSFLTCQDHGGRGRNQGSDWYPAELDRGYGGPWKGLLSHPWRCLPSGNIIFDQGIVFFNIVALEKQVFPLCLNSTTTWLLIINIQLNGWPGSPRTIRKT